MVHSSRNKQKASPQKREVVGEDGWTRIVSPRRKTQTTARSPPRPPSTDPLNPKSKTITTTYQRSELPSDTKVEQVIEKFKQLEKKWLQSDSWKLLKAALEDYTSNSTFDPIKTCIVFGTGTFSGLRQGWIERWDTALVQTAVFKSVADALEHHQNFRPLCYAQEPDYNHLDSAFLKTLNMVTIEDPEGFSLVKAGTFAYTPGAELDVELSTMLRNPTILLTGEINWCWRDENGIALSNRYGICSPFPEEKDMEMSIEEYEKKIKQARGLLDKIHREMENECRIVETFMDSHEGVTIPELDMNNMPFYNQCLYYQTSTQAEEQQADDTSAMADAMGNVTLRESPDAT